jgi:hypothetical protein
VVVGNHRDFVRAFVLGSIRSALGDASNLAPFYAFIVGVLAQRVFLFDTARPIGTSSVAALQQNFCSCIGTTHFDLRLAERGVSFDCRGWVHFIILDFRTRRAAARQCLRLLR